MASQHIEIKGNKTRVAAAYRQFIDHLAKLQDDAIGFQLIFAQASNGGDWQGLADLLGLTTANPVTDAQTISQLHDAMTSRLNNANIDTFVQRLG